MASYLMVPKYETGNAAARRFRERALTRYTVALLSVAVAVFIRWLLDPVLGDNVAFLTLYGGVAVAVWFGGWRPGLLAAVTGFLVADYLFIPPRGSFAIDKSIAWAGLAGYSLSCGFIIYLGEAMRRARQRAEQRGNLLEQEISERKRAEAALRASQERLQLSQQVANVGTFDWNIETGVNIWTTELEAMYGLPPGGFAKTQPAWESLVHPDDRASAVQKVELAFQMDQPVEGEWRVIWPDGNVHWLAGRFRVFKDPSGKPLRLTGVNIDITERKRIEDALRESEERFRIMADASTIAIWVTDIQGDVQFINRAYGEFFGVTIAQVKGPGGWRPLVHPEDLEEYAGAFLTSLRERKPFRAQARVRHADGQWRWMASYGSPRFSPTGEFLGAVGSSADITEIKAAEELLKSEAQQLEKLVQQRTEKLEEIIGELETFSYTIAHDMRAPLRAMQGFGELLVAEHSAQLDADGQNYLRRIVTAAQRMDHLIQDVLTYSRVGRDELRLAPVDLEKLMRGILESYPAFQAPRAEVLIQGSLPRVLGNEALLTQCISNLIGNAVKFVAPGVTPQVKIRAEFANSRPRLWFEDNGIGIEKDAHERIFGLFQRLSPKYEGTGIGLAIVRKAIERMGGRVGVESEPGQGSRFWIELNGVK